MSIESSWLMVLSSSILSLIFCLLESIAKRGVRWSISPFSSNNFCFVYFEALLLSTYTFRITMSSQ